MKQQLGFQRKPTGRLLHRFVDKKCKNRFAASKTIWPHSASLRLLGQENNSPLRKCLSTGWYILMLNLRCSHAFPSINVKASSK